MTKPSNFIMNTDYLSIAQTYKNSYTYVVPPGTIPASGQVIQHTDFAIEPQNGAVDQIMISLDSGNLRVGQAYAVDLPSGVGAVLHVDRTAANNLRAQVTINGTASTSYPVMTFTIKVVSFKPPNIM